MGPYSVFLRMLAGEMGPGWGGGGGGSQGHERPRDGLVPGVQKVGPCGHLLCLSSTCAIYTLTAHPYSMKELASSGLSQAEELFLTV